MCMPITYIVTHRLVSPWLKVITIHIEASIEELFTQWEELQKATDAKRLGLETGTLARAIQTEGIRNNYFGDARVGEYVVFARHAHQTLVVHPHACTCVYVGVSTLCHVYYQENWKYTDILPLLSCGGIN